MNTNIKTIFLNYKVYIFFYLSLIFRLCKLHLKNEKSEQIIFIIFLILNLKNFTSILHKFLFYVGWRDRFVLGVTDS